ADERTRRAGSSSRDVRTPHAPVLPGTRHAGERRRGIPPNKRARQTSGAGSAPSGVSTIRAPVAAPPAPDLPTGNAGSPPPDHEKPPVDLSGHPSKNASDSSESSEN